MKLIIKFAFLQLFWFFVITQMRNFPSPVFLLSSLFFVILDYFFYKPQKNIFSYSAFVLFLLVVGILNDMFSYYFSLLDFSLYTIGSLSLWVVFIGYYEDLSSRYKDIRFLYLFLLSGLIGSLTYFSAARLGGIEIFESKKAFFYSYQFFFWGLFFPLSLKLYRVDSMFDFLLDLSVVFSFDRSGFLRHKKKFNESFSYPSALNKNALVTGGSDGIGAMVTEKLTEYGANVVFTGRNLEKGLKLQEKLSGSNFQQLDMADWDQVDKFTSNSNEYDFIVLNAGGMPDKLSYNAEGVEHQCASQLVGHYRLLEKLRIHNKIKANARIVFVSSGGMYLKSLDISTLFQNHSYDKVATYANVKRAQVTLVEELSKKQEWMNFSLMCMHPGWVETQAVKDALPGFYNFLGKRLRSPYEGADTILWCLLTSEKIESGGFYFDRQKVSAYISSFFNPSVNQRALLLSKLKDYINA